MIFPFWLDWLAHQIHELVVGPAGEGKKASSHSVLGRPTDNTQDARFVCHSALGWTTGRAQNAGFLHVLRWVGGPTGRRMLDFFAILRWVAN